MMVDQFVKLYILISLSGNPDLATLNDPRRPNKFVCSELEHLVQHKLAAKNYDMVLRFIVIVCFTHFDCKSKSF